MNEDKGTFKERNEAKRLDNESARLKRGFLHGTLLPAATWTVVVVICCFSIRHFCIENTIFDTSEAARDSNIYYDAQRDYNDGNLELAASQLAKVLAKVPSHGPANQLMARIALARGDRKSALSYLHRSLEGSLNREEVAKWISTLEAMPQK